MSSENLTRAECAERSSLVSSKSYVVKLDLRDVNNSDTFNSHTTVTFSGTDGSSSWIDLIAPEVIRITLNGEVLDLSLFDGFRIQLPNLKSENVLEVEATCQYSITGEGLHKFRDPADDEIYLYSQFEIADARRVFACFDQPDLKATFAFEVSAPSHWKVFSNTTAKITDVENGKLHVFKPTPRISTYITAICAGNYYGVEDSYTGKFGTYPLGLYCRQSLSEFLDAEDMFLITKQGFGVFENAFDLGYPFEKYDQIIVPEFNAGAMENAGCVTFYEGVIYRSRATDHERESRSNTILHEMAHMWFGDLVTMKWWDDLWLNESFAEWASYYANNAGTRFKQAWTAFMVDRKLWAYREDQLSGTHPIATDMVDLDTVEVNFDGITYAKGASTLRQLVAFVGEVDFMKGISAYFKKHAWGNTELKDLLHELELASGRDLSGFTKSWLQTSGVNLMYPEIELDDDGTYKKVLIKQLPPLEPAGLTPELRTHRMAIGLYNNTSSGLTRTNKVEIDVSGAETVVEKLTGVTQPDLLLLNDEDLTFSKIRLDARSLKTAVESTGDIPDSLPRALLLSAAWDMTRDAEMSTGDFIKLVERALPKETFIPIIQRVLVQLRTAAQLYSHPTKREQHLSNLADTFLDWAQSFEQESDAQFAAAKNFVAIARTEKQLDVVAKLYSEEMTIPGIKVDTDFRWLLLDRLVQVGKAGVSEIEAEEARDKTSTGRNNAAKAKAAIPTIEAKAKAWTSIMKDESLSNDVLNATVMGFYNPDHKELLVEYVDKYFDILPSIWSSRSNEIAQTITLGLYPMYQFDESTVNKTEAFLSTADVPHGCKRLVGDGKDGLVRALKCQQADA
ncbi:MAG: aminopeptidase N [Candidatus Nanopelagicales bacterium]